jgi:outer membrane protein assembly factor BamD
VGFLFKGLEKFLRRRILLAVTLVALNVFFLPGCAFYHRHRHSELNTQFGPGDQPDKVLFEKASNEITHNRYDVGRLTLQTLINTYPDSEFLSRAKLEIADSYYNEGGVSGLTQAEAEYKDFITFFPTAPEAPEAQFRVGMAHYRLMAKADRDETEARLAEAEFKEFLLKYPDSPVMPRAKARLREAQEVLAEGEYWTADFYFTHGAYLASRARLQGIVEKYPNFSQGDYALYNLGQSLEHIRKAHDAVPYYQRVITEFPLSPLVPQAKARLVALKEPVPRPTRAMLARARADAAHRQPKDILSRMTDIMSSVPDTSTTLHGPVRLGATAEGQVAKTPGGGGVQPTNTIVVSPVSDSSLKSEKPADAQTKSEDTNAKPKDESAQKTTSGTSQTTEAPKKKSRLHKLKKIVDPF